MNVNIIFKGFVTYNLDALSSLLCCAGVLDDDSAFELMLKTYLRMTMMKLLLEADILPVILLVVDVHATDDQEQDPRRKLQRDNLYHPACN